MPANGYTYDKDKMFFYDLYDINYLNCAYYHGELCGGERLLGAYSLYEKGDIAAWTLLKLYRVITADEIADDKTGSDPFILKKLKDVSLQLCLLTFDTQRVRII